MADPVAVETDFFEVIGTQRAMRRLKPDPVPEEYIKKIIWAASLAPTRTVPTSACDSAC